MSDQLKYIVQELNKPPFNKNVSVITFDALRGKQLIKLLNDVFVELEEQQNVPLDEEGLEDTATRLLTLLKVFKYPQALTHADQLKEGLTEGNKTMIHSLLEWTLQRMPDLKKRAYLAKFLVKLDIPQDMLADIEVNNVHQQYLALIEQFKEVHKHCDQLRQAEQSSAEVKRDISNMEEEKKQLKKRVERMKKKVENFPKVENMLSVARNLRQEREREDSLNTQKQELHSTIQRAEQKLQRLSQELRDVRQSKAEASPEALVQRCEQEVKVNTYILKEKLPKEIKSKEKYITILEKVANHPEMTQADLDKIHSQIQAVQSEVSKLVEKRMMANEPMDDKLSMFRQQAAIIARKKESTAETMDELQANLSSQEEQIKAQREKLAELGGIEILKGDEFKQYVTKLRAKSNTYKKKKQEQSELKAELGVLVRTEEILKQKLEQLGHSLDAIDAEISSLQNDAENGQNVTDMRGIVTKMNREVSAKKKALATTVKEVRVLRQQCQELTMEYDEAKASYNSVAAGLEANVSKLEKEVASLEDKHNSQESRAYLLKQQIEILKVQLEQANNELKIYLSGDAAAKKQSLREQYNQCISEQERLSKALKEEQKTVRDNYQKKTEQMQMWKDLQRLMECKHKISKRQNNSADSYIGRLGSTS